MLTKSVYFLSSTYPWRLKLTSPSDFSLSFWDLSLSPLQGIRGSSGLEYRHPTAFKEMQQKQKSKMTNEIIAILCGYGLLFSRRGWVETRSEHMKPPGRVRVWTRCSTLRSCSSQPWAAVNTRTFCRKGSQWAEKRWQKLRIRLVSKKV